MKKILVLAANPKQDLDLRREIHILKSVIERAQEGDEFEIKIDSAVCPQDLQKLFYEHKPRIVHFCGHGMGDQGLVLEDGEGKETLVSTLALSNLFKEFSDKVECVLLNACYSEQQADVIAQHINYAIGMSQAIRDDAAIIFARGFYQALAYGKSIPDAFESGRTAIELQISNLKISRSDVSKKERKFMTEHDVDWVDLPEYLKPQIKLKSSLTLFSEEKLSSDSATFPDLTKIIKEEIARKRYREARQEDFGLGRTSPQRRQPLNQQEYRWKKVLLNKVKDSWIKGVLENSLHTKVLFELDIKKHSDLEECSQDSDKSFEWLQASDIFEEMGAGRTLLILGEPGTGKTISLLRLAERLIKRTEQDLSLPIPVVFNLSSWGIKRQPIADWLISELNSNYSVSSALGKQWVDQEDLILLLDGLDEVKSDFRNDCVKYLNEFIATYFVTEIVVCSRIRDYEALSKRLKLRSAICIQPLSSEYIDWYLEDVGKPLSGLRKLLHNDKELEKFARTPLIFSVMTITYQNYSLEALLKEMKVKKDRYTRLFNNYIEKMYPRRNTQDDIYSIQKLKFWLTYLAKKMKYYNKSLFLIDHINVGLLENKFHKWLFSLGVWLIVWLLVLLLLLYFSFAMYYIISLGNHYTPSPNNVEIPRVMKMIVSISYPMLIIGLIFIPTFSIIFPKHNDIIKPVEVLNWNSFNFKDISNLCFWIYAGTIVTLVTTISSGSISSLYLVPAFNRIGTLSNNLLYGKSLRTTEIPNQGIWNSISNTISFALLGILLNFALMGILNIGFIVDLSNNLSYLWMFCLLILPLLIACLFIIFKGIAASVFALGKHLLLRTILFFEGYIPWDYSKFLDFAAEHLFMQKVGGGYIFIHRMLLEHFAQMKEEEKRS